ncbi:MAG TPA: hypothetical protein VHC86_05860 [Opitutaceae bacterium]|nr:hypothetical protein [Opitutaceae bacterium]
MHRAIALSLGLALAGTLRAQGWTRADVGNFRVYTDASEKAVAPLLGDLLTTEMDLQAVWPTARPGQPPGVLVFCAQSPEYYALNPTVTGRSLAMTGGSSPEWSFAIMVNLAPPAPGHPAPVGPALRRFYADYFVRSVGERIPPWFQLGMLKLLESARLRSGVIELPPLSELLDLPGRAAGSEAGLKRAVADRYYIGLESLLGATSAPRGEDGVRFGYEGRGTALSLAVASGTFVDESMEFIEFCLFGEGGRLRPAFIRFVRAATNGPLDEADFRKFLGMDYSALLLEVWRSPELRNTRVIRVPAPPRGVAAAVPPGSFRPVGQAELDGLAAHWGAAHRGGEGN